MPNRSTNVQFGILAPLLLNTMLAAHCSYSRHFIFYYQRIVIILPTGILVIFYLFRQIMYNILHPMGL